MIYVFNRLKNPENIKKMRGIIPTGSVLLHAPFDDAVCGPPGLLRRSGPSHWTHRRRSEPIHVGGTHLDTSNDITINPFLWSPFSSWWRPLLVTLLIYLVVRRGGQTSGAGDSDGPSVYT